MYVCLCNGVTEHAIQQAVSAGCSTMAELTMRTGCGAGCGSCICTAIALLDDAHAAAAAGSDIAAQPMPSHSLMHLARYGDASQASRSAQ